MKTIPKPELDVTPEEIFDICTKTAVKFSDNGLRSACKKAIQIDSENYDRLVPFQIDELILSKTPEHIEGKDLADVYSEKFAKQGSPGRIYYDQIRANVKDGKCPICGMLPISTLDHYLPKSKAPTLSVTSSNLIPTCLTCNMSKGMKMNLNPNETPVHVYFEGELISKDIWLWAEIGSNFEVVYYVKCPDTWEPELRNRIGMHLETYNLNIRYSSFAEYEIANKLYAWREILSLEDGTEQLKLSFMKTRKSAEQNDLNSWYAALYRYLENHIDQISRWIARKDK